MKFFMTLCLLALTVCLQAPFATAGGAKPIVFVSIAPQKYFVEQVAGDLVDVKTLVSVGDNPHTYEPTSSQMVALTKAKAYFSIGINFEEVWLPRITGTAPSLRIVHTQRGVQKIPMVAHGHNEEEHEEHHDHGAHKATHDHEEHHDHDMHHEHEATTDASDHDHDHGTLDPHIWLDPIRVRTVAKNICAGLIKIDPQNKVSYEANLSAFLTDLDQTDKAIAQIMESVPSAHRSFLVFHPSWGYFADRYGLTQMAIEVSGREPSPKTLTEIVTHSKEEGIKVVFIQPQISKKTATVLAREIGAEVKQLDPLAEDWKNNLMEAAQAFKSVLN